MALKIIYLFRFSGPEDTTSLNYSPDGNFLNHQQSVTLVASSGNDHLVPILCWVLLIVLLLSIVASLAIICCVGIKSKRFGRRKKRPRLSSHINGFSGSHVVSPVEMLPKYVSSPAQSYSTQKLYQWCQQKEAQQYKSLWTVNPVSGKFKRNCVFDLRD